MMLPRGFIANYIPPSVVSGGIVAISEDAGSPGNGTLLSSSDISGVNVGDFVVINGNSQDQFNISQGGPWQVSQVDTADNLLFLNMGFGVWPGDGSGGSWNVAPN